MRGTGLVLGFIGLLWVSSVHAQEAEKHQLYYQEWLQQAWADHWMSPNTRQGLARIAVEQEEACMLSARTRHYCRQLVKASLVEQMGAAPERSFRITGTEIKPEP